MTLLAKQFMSRDLVSVGQNETLSAAFEEMNRNKIRHLPVVDKKGALVGIISDRDLKRATEVASRQQGFDNIRFDPGALVRDYMSFPVETAAVDTPLNEITSRMIEKKISALVIANNKEIVGVVTHEDLLKVLNVFLRSPFQPSEAAFGWKHNSPIGDFLSFLEGSGY